ncbi:hypothetical protein JOM56_005050 [Amanita muscaria]
MALNGPIGSQSTGIVVLVVILIVKVLSRWLGAPLGATKEFEDVPPASVITDVALSTERIVEKITLRNSESSTEHLTMSKAETNPNLENELPPRPWTPSYAVRLQGSPAAVPKEVEVAPPLDTESIEQSIPDLFPIGA